jgi:hypothetical protein
MEINYDLIVKYLTVIKNTFVSKKHILVCSDTFPDKFKTFLQNKFYRYGIDQTPDNFYVSLLILLNKHFLTLTSEEELLEVNKLKKLVLDDKFELIKKLNMNLIIFDFKNENINILHADEICNPYKPTILIAQYENFYEPIINECDNKKIFSYNDQIIKNIFQNVLQNKLKDNINDILSEFGPIEKDDDDNKDENKVFIKSEIESSTKLLKMTKKELQVILDNKKIKVNISKMLKKDIVDLILKN